MANIGYYNGKMGPVEEMTVPMLDRAVYFGDGCYEAVPCAHGVPFRLEPHIERFYRSCEKLEIKFHLTPDELRAELMKCVAAAELPSAMLYWQCSRGTAERNHAYPEGVKPNLLAMVKTVAPPDMVTRIKLRTAEDTRYTLCDVKTINLVINCMESDRTERQGCKETVLHRGDIVTECAHSNVSILKDGELVSHPRNNLILAGTSLAALEELGKKRGVPFVEREYTVAELMDADEVLVTSSSALCRAACEVDGKPVGGKAPELLQTLLDDFMDKYLRETGQK